MSTYSPNAPIGELILDYAPAITELDVSSGAIHWIGAGSLTNGPIDVGDAKAVQISLSISDVAVLAPNTTGITLRIGRFDGAETPTRREVAATGGRISSTTNSVSSFLAVGQGQQSYDGADTATFTYGNLARYLDVGWVVNTADVTNSAGLRVRIRRLA